MNPCQANAGTMRRWQVPAQAARNGELPGGFRPLLLRLTAQSIELELRQTDVLVGRHTLVDLCLPYPDVSRKHCRIVFADDVWHIMDMGSLNGIQVNGERKREADLHEGDVLGIAGLQFEVHEDAGEFAVEATKRFGEARPALRQIASMLDSQKQDQARKAS
jgi:pSer/pThr/pTyr-binding forkhead associated (FHA) protein